MIDPDMTPASTITTTIAELGERLWAWRDATAFHTGDDIPRAPRPPRWQPEFDIGSIALRLIKVDEFRAELDALDLSQAGPGDHVDVRLLRSALERVWWQCQVLRSWEQDACFLVGQVLGPYFDLLLPPPPFGPERQQEILAALLAVPDQTAVAIGNLTIAGRSGLAAVAAADLADIATRVTASVQALQPLLDEPVAAAVRAAAEPAGAALERFATFLRDEGPGWPAEQPVGTEAFLWYLRQVALIPDDPTVLLQAATQEYARSSTWETVARARQGPDPAPFSSVAEQVRVQAEQEQRLRSFADELGLLSDDACGHYRIAPLPPYLAPLSFLGVNDDLTSRDRLRDDAVSYTPDPGPGLPYFYAANAIDPRLGLIHEGAHHQQLVRSWCHRDPIRRHYYDSVPNEGIAHYFEELMLQAGLFDDAPASRTRVHNFMRLRAWRVVIDVSLAIGAIDLDDAVASFVTRVPMDEATARAETAMYLANPGLAMAYLVGKQQVLRLVADLLARPVDPPGLRTTHDWIWASGNAPIALLRYELLGDRTELDLLDADTTPRPPARRR